MKKFFSYIVSADIYILLDRWAKQTKFVLPAKSFFEELRKKFSLKMETLFDQFELISEKEISTGLKKIIVKSNFQTLSLDRIYFQSNANLDLTRLVDKKLNNIGKLGHRSNTLNIKNQLQTLKDAGLKYVTLIDDVIYSGEGMLWVIDKLKEFDIEVKLICAGIGISSGVQRLEKLGYIVKCVRLIKNVIDEVCERDFYIVPGTGRLQRIKKEDWRVPYFKPFGLANKWASISIEKEIDFSIFCLEQNISLFKKIEEYSNRKISCKELGFKVLGLPEDNTMLVDALKDILEKLSQKNSIIKELTKKLDATYVGEYPSGHSSAVITRLKRKNGSDIVAKFSLSQNDIEGNIMGYEQISKIGASAIIPTECRKIYLKKNLALIMTDLGLNFRSTTRNILDYQNIRNSFLKIVKKTTCEDTQEYIKTSMLEIKEYISKYLTKLTNILGKDATKNISTWMPNWDFKYSSLMLLDFTPDNVFMKENKIYFIDPWRQKNYLGHPAVSLGQFSTLAHNIYNLPASKKGKKILKELAIIECSKILKCSEDVSKKAFNAGEILQYILSAYVRRKSDKAKSRKFLEKANKIVLS